MSNRIERAFGDIRADDALLEKTAAYLREQRAGNSKKRRTVRPLRLAGAFAVMLALVVGLFGYRDVYYSAATYVSIDVNPSVELTLNRMDTVIAATAYNADGETVLQQVDLSGRPYDEAVDLLLSEMQAQGYLGSDALITMTVQTADSAKEQALCAALLQAADERMGAEASSTEVEVFPVTQEVRETAYGCHMSAAKYLAIQELMEVDDTATLEDYSASSIRQIRQQTRECRSEHEASAETGAWGGGQEHNGSSQNQGSGGHGEQWGGQRQSQESEPDDIQNREPEPDDSQSRESDHGNGAGQGGDHGHGGGHRGGRT